MHKFFFLKPIEKYNQDSVSILQGTLPHPIRSMEQGRVRSFSYAFLSTGQSRAGQGRARSFSYAFFVNRVGQGRVQDRTGQGRAGQGTLFLLCFFVNRVEQGRTGCEKLPCGHLCSTLLLHQMMNVKFCAILLKGPIVSENLVAVFECHRKPVLYISSMIH